MAKSSPPLLLLLLLLLLLAASWPRSCNAATPFCAGKCKVRCGRRAAAARVKQGCMRYCGLCCEECSCVPTSGRRDECPCYRDMLTAGPTKRPKCP